MEVYFARSTGVYINDSMFINLGFFTGSSTQFQRNLAYGIAESQIAEEIGTFLSPTTITGTFPFAIGYGKLVSPVGRLISINSATFHQRYSNNTERLISGTAVVYDWDNGYFNLETSTFDVSQCSGCGDYGNSFSGIYKVDISITAGYQTGTIMNDPKALLAIGMAADLALKNFYDEGISYEENMYLANTTQIGRIILSVQNKFFTYGPVGISPKAQYIRNLIRHLKIRRVGRWR